MPAAVDFDLGHRARADGAVRLNEIDIGEELLTLRHIGVGLGAWLDRNGAAATGRQLDRDLVVARRVLQRTRRPFQVWASRPRTRMITLRSLGPLSFIEPLPSADMLTQLCFSTGSRQRLQFFLCQDTFQ